MAFLKGRALYRTGRKPPPLVLSHTQTHIRRDLGTFSHSGPARVLSSLGVSVDALPHHPSNSSPSFHPPPHGHAQQLASPGNAPPLKFQHGLQPPSCASHSSLSIETSHSWMPPHSLYSVQPLSLYFLLRSASRPQSNPLVTAFITIFSSSEPPLAPALPNPTLKGQPLGIHMPQFIAPKLLWEKKIQPRGLEFLQLHGLQSQLGPSWAPGKFPVCPILTWAQLQAPSLTLHPPPFSSTQLCCPRSSGQQLTSPLNANKMEAPSALCSQCC